jgi:hypothetical protein
MHFFKAVVDVVNKNEDEADAENIIMNNKK